MATLQETKNGVSFTTDIRKGPGKFELFRNLISLHFGTTSQFEVDASNIRSDFRNEFLDVKIFGVIPKRRWETNEDWLVVGEVCPGFCKQFVNTRTFPSLKAWFIAEYSTKTRTGRIKINIYNTVKHEKFKNQSVVLADLLKNFQ